MSSPAPDATPTGQVDMYTLYRRLDRAVRVGFAVLAVFAGLLAMRVAWSIPLYEQMFAELLPGRMLPTLTLWVLATQLPLMYLTAALPVVAVYLTLSPIRSDYAIYGIIFCVVVEFLLCILIWYAMFSPLVAIVHGLSAR